MFPSSSFEWDITEAFNFIKSAFLHIIKQIDLIVLRIGSLNFSLLDLLLAFIVLGAILPIVLVTIKNWGSSNVADYKSRVLYETRRAERKNNK